MADQYIYMLECLRGFKKSLKKLLVKAMKTERETQISNVYLLLDAHVYLKCNAWSREAEC
jgi:hypothetical protein